MSSFQFQSGFQNSNNSNFSNHIIALLSVIICLVASNCIGQTIHAENYESQPSFENVVFQNQPQIIQSPFEEQQKIMPFSGNKSFDRFHVSDLELNLSVFPNPAIDEINLEIPEYGVLSISNLSGMEIISGNVNAGSVNIDLTDFPVGVYLITLSNPDFTLSNRLVITE